ncbi:hypothetical protein HX792_10360 [Pseudomonas sp. B6002]|uniref:hypothetical protein n=1 Tax=Pseudomonas sp. B6002 TaxID=2726978 RepID=UPI0015A123B6|nr:hypothetical protein [Pseudomonas sp. B6002]NVZ50738.1 hypothetical protein [Pseudomonas sp. B6002]
MFLLMMFFSVWWEDPAYIVNEENCTFGHYVELPNDYRSSRLMTGCFANIKEDHKPTGGGDEKTVRPLKELRDIPVDLR